MEEDSDTIHILAVALVASLFVASGLIYIGSVYG